MRNDILLLILIPAIATVISLYFGINYLFGVIFFYLAPGLFMAIKYRKKVWRPTLFAILAGLPFTLIVDYIGTASNLWNVPRSVSPLFLNVISIEDYIWMISAIFTCIMLSGISDATQPKHFLTPRMKASLGGGLIAVIGFFILYGLYGHDFFVFHTPYLYIILGTVFFALPTILLGIYFKSFPKRHAFTVGYFFLLTIIFESIAVYNSWWEFNGAYFLQPLTISGKFLPTEELFFVGIVGSSMAIMLYRFLMNNERRD